MIRWSVISLGGFSEIDSSHSTGISANSRTSVIAIAHSEYSLAPTFISSAPRSAFLDLDAEAFDEQRGEQHHTEEDQDRDRRADAQVESVDQLFEAEDRHRFGVLRAVGHDEDRVEDARGLEHPEEHRDEDRRFHQRQRDLHEALPGGGAVDLRRLVELVR